MSLRLIAKDLYRLIKEVENLENQIRGLPPEERETLLARLRKTRAERDRLRRALEGRKDRPADKFG